MTRSITGFDCSPLLPPTYTVYVPGDTGIYTPPSGCLYIIVEMIGGGGGGGWVPTDLGVGGGGGAAGYMKLLFPAASYPYTVGASGIAGSEFNGGMGVNGGNTTFGSAVSQGGRRGRNDAAGGVAGLNTTAGIVLLSIRGVFGGTTYDPLMPPSGGASFLGPSQGFSNYINPFPVTASGYGAGGSGSSGNLTSVAGNGGPGRIVITEFYY